SYSFYNLTGLISVSGNASEVKLKDIVVQFTPLSGVVFPNSNVVMGTPTINNMTGAYIANYSVLVLGSAGGMEYVIEFYGNGSGEYFGALQNISVGAANASLNTTLYRLAGVYDNTSSVANTSRVTFNATNGSIALTSAHVEIEVVHSSFNSTNNKLRYMFDTLTNGTFKMVILNQSTVKVKVFSNQYAPKQSKFTTFPGTGMFNVTLYPFNPEQVLANGSRVAYSGISIAFYKDNATCSVPAPGANCFLGSFGSDFNPLKAMLGGKTNVMINSSNGVVTYFIGADLLGSGPPDAVMSDSSLQNITTSNSLAQMWRFGSMAPEIYSHVLISIPYNESLVNESWVYKTVLPYLYDEDWNIVWNTTANGTGVNLTDYSGYNSTWFTGMVCSKNNTGADCYMDRVNNRFWFKIPHFSGGDYNLSGGVINVTMGDPVDANISNLTTQTFTCNTTSTGTISNITFYIWNSTGLQNSNTNTSGGTINSSSYTFNLSVEGNYTWSCLVYDIGGAYEWGLNRTFRVDTSYPFVDAVTNTSITDTSVKISWNVSDASIVNITYSSNASDMNQTALNTTYVIAGSVTIINLIPNLTYFYNITACNQLGYCNNSILYNFTTLNDTTAPNVTFLDPSDANGTTIGRNYSFVNVSVNDTNLNISACWLEWFNSTNGTTITMNMSATGANIYCYYNKTNLPDGLHNYTVHANDTRNNTYNTTVRFLTVDDTPPFVSTYGPQTTVTETTATFSVTTNENATCHYSTSSGTVYASMSGTFTDSGTAHTKALTGLTAGTTYYYVRCNDTIGNVNETDYRATITVASSASTTTSSGGGGSSTAVKTEKKQSFSAFNPGIASVINNFDSSLGLRELSIMVKNKVTSVTITIDKITAAAAPSGVSGTAYKYVEINKSSDINSDIDYVNISFQVEKSWVTSNTINPALIYLNRYTTQWDKLETAKTGSDSTYYYYVAKAPGMSYFAISGDALVVVCTENAKECSGSELRECKDNGWVINETCEYGCNATATICMSATGCENNIKQCVDNKLQLCLNDSWILDKTCEFGCNSTAFDCDSALVDTNETVTNGLPMIEMDTTLLIVAVMVLIVLGILVYFFFFREAKKYSYKPGKKK
ncbi:MAG: PGF-pre-PGF domain-containing protein, partial [Candidatus Aenigmatarchaeota archaeon]